MRDLVDIYEPSIDDRDKQPLQHLWHCFGHLVLCWHCGVPYNESKWCSGPVVEYGETEDT